MASLLSIATMLPASISKRTKTAQGRNYGAQPHAGVAHPHGLARVDVLLQVESAENVAAVIALILGVVVAHDEKSERDEDARQRRAHTRETRE